jgi:two-component system nitrate/nitrite response regulator NarL
VPDPPRVLVVADDPLTRSGLALLLESEPRVAVLAQSDSAQAAPLARLHRPDAVVWVLEAGAAALPDALRTLADSGPPVVALAADEAAASAALAAAARAVLARDAPPERVAAAVRAALDGLIVLDPSLAALLQRSAAGLDPPVEALTARENEVLQLLAQGLTNRAIGERLGISEHTAKFHVNAILGKLGAQGRTDAVVRAARLGLIVL